MYVLEASECQIGQNLTPQSTSTDDQNLGCVSQESFNLARGLWVKSGQTPLIAVTYLIASGKRWIRARPWLF